MVSAGDGRGCFTGGRSQVFQFIHDFGREAAITGKIGSEPRTDILVGRLVIALVEIIAPQIASAPVVRLNIAARQTGHGITAMAISDLNRDLHAFRNLLAVLFLGIIDRVPLFLVVVLRRFDLLRGRRGEHGFFGDLFELWRDVIRIASGIRELFGDGGHIELEAVIRAEIDDQRHAPFAALRTIVVLVPLLIGGAVIGCLWSISRRLRSFRSCWRMRRRWSWGALRTSRGLWLLGSG